MRSEDFSIKSLGPCRIPSPLKLELVDGTPYFNFVSDENKILYEVEKTNEAISKFAFEKAGPREKIYYDSSKIRAGIVTCGGLCPGINNVIRTLVMQLYHNYGVRHIQGFRYGFQGFIPSFKHETMDLNPESVQNVHNIGGSILSSSRGPQDIGEIVDCIERQDIRQLFCIYKIFNMASM